MMKHWSFYDPQSGYLSGRKFSATDESALVYNTPEGLAAIEGRHDHFCCRVDIATGEVVDYQPPQPSTEHDWDETTKRWRLNAEASGRAERKTVALARIAHLEANVQPRAHRELLLKIANRLGIDGEQSQSIDDEIAGLRKNLEG